MQIIYFIFPFYKNKGEGKKQVVFLTDRSYLLCSYHSYTFSSPGRSEIAGTYLCGGDQFYVPAEMASLPSLVAESKLAKANSMFFLTQQLSLIIGFGFAGIIQNYVGFEGSLAICAGALFIAFISVLFLPKLNQVVNRIIQIK